MSKHTPGPWQLGPINCGDGRTIFAPVEAGNKRIAHTSAIRNAQGDLIDPETAQANARLIAAAPDLLAACKALIGVFMDDQEDVPLYVRKARAAIAKAEGRDND